MIKYSEHTQDTWKHKTAKVLGNGPGDSVASRLVSLHTTIITSLNKEDKILNYSCLPAYFKFETARLFI